ncbi:MAG: hypothetical protein ACJAQT_002039 [Akkermansiaceae bacterium]
MREDVVSFLAVESGNEEGEKGEYFHKFGSEECLLYGVGQLGLSNWVKVVLRMA